MISEEPSIAFHENAILGSSVPEKALGNEVQGFLDSLKKSKTGEGFTLVYVGFTHIEYLCLSRVFYFLCYLVKRESA